MADKQTVKVGDKVKSLVTQLDVRKGVAYEVKTVDFDGDIWVTDDVGDRFYLTTDEFELLPVADATGKPALTIETGKFYRTRDGRKVGPMRRQAFGWVASKRIIATDQCDWYEGGNFSLYRDREHDLISEWVDESTSNDNQPVAEQQAGTVFIDASKASPSQLHLAKGPLVRLNKGYYGYELARYGDYVWVEIGQKAPIVMRADAVTVAA